MVLDLDKTLTIQGVSGNTYIFNVYGFTRFSDLHDAFKDIPALYVFTKRGFVSGSFIHDLIYVGETGDLSKRFDNHHKENCIMRCDANCICIHSFPGSESERRMAEMDILNAFDFPCNDKSN